LGAIWTRFGKDLEKIWTQPLKIFGKILENLDAIWEKFGGQADL
jgi:hypothetical protein